MNPSTDQSIASRLLNAVIAKSFIEILLICAVASVAAFTNFSPLLRGAIDVADQRRVAGWVHDPVHPDEAIEVQLFIDGKFIASTIAGERRDDLVSAGAAKRPDHGFSFNLDVLNLAQGKHSAQVYAVRGAIGSNKTLVPISKSPRYF